MIKIDKMSGLVKSTPFHPSPHCDERPSSEIDLIVIHAISLPPKEFGMQNIDLFFLGKLDPKAHPYFQTISHLKVSSHIVIGREGEMIQYVPFTKRAWHAGQSKFQNRLNCNDFSIGIELVGADDVAYEEKQYQTLAKLIFQLQNVYQIEKTHLVGHEDIAHGRKTDPGSAFLWDFLHRLLKYEKHSC
ncbi:MAG: hypothetical protein ACD_44C00221G0004 [uncultured bacterium]|nr:MAG: hypothetical protein ACD_44C00221G0004 [uncultured bacterium]